jgi:hypothetical protein
MFPADWCVGLAGARQGSAAMRLHGIERLDNRRGFRHEGAADDFGSWNLRLRFRKSRDINLIRGHFERVDGL